MNYAFGEENVYHEPKYGKPEHGGPDWIVIDKDTAILIECRSSRLRLNSKIYADHEDLLKDTRRIFLETLEKYPGKIADFMDGSMDIDATGVTHCEAIVVMYDQLFVESYYREVAREHFAQKGLTPFDDYHFMGVVDLEVLTGWNSTHPMKTLLLKNKEARTQEMQDFNAFLRTYSKDHDLNFMHPLLKEVFDEFFAKHFQISADGTKLELEEPTADSTSTST